jgi:ankyrin repeat protein
MTPVFYAIFNHNDQIFQLFYSLGADLLIQDKINKAALVYLIESMPSEVDYLNSQNFDFQKFTTKNSMSLVFYAYSVKLFDVVKKLFTDGNNINSLDSNGNSILMLASYDNNLDLVDFMIRNKANLNQQSKDGNTAMHYAIISDSSEVIEKLFKAGADFSIKNKLLFTPLQSAVMYLKPKSFLYLVYNLQNFKNDALAKNYNNLSNNICKNVEYNYTETCQSYVKKLYTDHH